MTDLAKKIRTRFMNSKDIHITARKLEKEGYNIVGGIYGTTKDGKAMYYLDVFKDNNRIIQVIYTYRDDDTEYKQYIHTILY